MNKRAHLRQVGVLLIERMVKEGQQPYPAESWNEYRSSPEEAGLEDEMRQQQRSAAQQMLMNNPEYLQRLQSLYSRTYGYQDQSAPQTLSETVAAQKEPGSISAENVPKVVSAPK